MAKPGHGHLPDEGPPARNEKIDLPPIVGEKISSPLRPFHQDDLSTGSEVLPSEFPQLTGLLDAVEVHVDNRGTPLADISKEEIEGGGRNGSFHSGPPSNRPGKNRFPSSQRTLEAQEKGASSLAANTVTPMNEVLFRQDHLWLPLAG
jgi:hypothetical protein